MTRLYFFLSISILMTLSCQSNDPVGGEILFGDVVGKYEGECADFSTSTSDLHNREDASLNVYVKTPTSAGIKASCERFEEFSLTMKSASASVILFEEAIGNSLVTLKYIAVSDSIILTQTQNNGSDNLIFAGIRN